MFDDQIRPTSYKLTCYVRWRTSLDKKVPLGGGNKRGIPRGLDTTRTL
jgi:hypothetical protein